MASGYQTTASVVYVTEEVRGSRVSVSHWTYPTNRNKHMVCHLGRRVGKHDLHRKAHLTEDLALSNIQRQELHGGHRPAYRQPQGEDATLYSKRREEMLSALKYREELLNCILPERDTTPAEFFGVTRPRPAVQRPYVMSTCAMEI